MFLVTSGEMSQMDQLSINFFGIPERVLMENAGRAAAGYFLELLADKINKSDSVGILAGAGNNGGDSFVIARYLVQKGIPVNVFLLSKREKIKLGAASENFDLMVSLGIPFSEIPDLKTFNKIKSQLKLNTIWIDAIIGTGLKHNVKKFTSRIINFINDLKQPIFAVDLPSGLDSDTGQVHGACIHAFATVSFAFPKIGHFLYPGRSHAGKLKIVDIGIPVLAAKRTKCKQYLLNFGHIKKRFLSRKDNVHKGISGHLVVVAGSIGKTGAAVMTSLAAMRSGAGLVTLCIPEGLNKIVEPMLVEAMTIGLPEISPGELDISATEVVKNLLKNKKCVAFGPGVGKKSGACFLLEYLVKNCSLPLVIDADGLNIIANNISILKHKKGPIILTPHPGEMSSLTGESITNIQSDRISVARDFAKKFDVHVVLKGAATVIAHPNGKVFLNPTGNSGMASGGMGDVLTGMLAAFIVQGYPVEWAIRVATYIHGLSGDAIFSYSKIPYGYLATDVIKNIPKQISILHHSADNTLSKCKYTNSFAYDINE